MCQPHTIDARHMAEWIDDEMNEMRPYASSSTEDKRLLVSLAGVATVYHGESVVYMSRDLARAIEVYNGITSPPGEQQPSGGEPIAVAAEAKPVRTRYRHMDPNGIGCGFVTRMSVEDACRFSESPTPTLYCGGCAQHQPSNVFVWEGSSERVSTKGDR